MWSCTTSDGRVTSPAVRDGARSNELGSLAAVEGALGLHLTQPAADVAPAAVLSPRPMDKALVQPPKGSRDFLPADLRKREHVTRIVRRVYEAHGFEPLETPTFERLETLMGKYGDEGDQLLFKILRRGQPLVDGLRQASELLNDPSAIVRGRSGETLPRAEPMLADLGLRYDLTVPLARVMAAHQGVLPPVFKRYQIQPVWRADTPGKGRFREFYQCDVDVCGSQSLVVEAEVLGAAAMCLKELGFADFNLRINHRQLLRALIQVCEIAPEHEVDAITAIDKLDKVGREGVDKELAARGVPESSRSKLLDVLSHGTSFDQLETKLGGNELGKQALSDLRHVMELCAFNAAAGHVKFDPALARGLGYYTGCIFEVQVPDLAGSLGGGGRYDGLIGMFLGKDKQIPACGLSLGLERILVVMEERKMFPANLSPVDCMLGVVDDKDTAFAVKLSHMMRQAGFSVDLQARAYKPGKLRQAAETRGVRYVVWIESDGRIEHKINGDAGDAGARDTAFGNVLTAAGRP